MSLWIRTRMDGTILFGTERTGVASTPEVVRQMHQIELCYGKLKQSHNLLSDFDNYRNAVSSRICTMQTVKMQSRPPTPRFATPYYKSTNTQDP